MIVMQEYFVCPPDRYSLEAVCIYPILGLFMVNN